MSNCHFTGPHPRELDPFLARLAEIVDKPGSVDTIAAVDKRLAVIDRGTSIGKAVAIGRDGGQGGVSAQLLGFDVGIVPGEIAEAKTVVQTDVIVGGID